MIAAYKVRHDGGVFDGLFARQGFWGWSERGKTWSSRHALNCALSHWLGRNRYLRDGTYRTDLPAAVPDFPADWTVIELTATGLREIPVQEFYYEKRKK